MKLSFAGLVLCGAYVVFAAFLFLITFSSSDIKSSYVAGQMAVLPAVLLVSLFHLERWVIDNPWANSYPLHFGVSVALCYLVGRAFSSLWNFRRRR